MTAMSVEAPAAAGVDRLMIVITAMMVAIAARPDTRGEGSGVRLQLACRQKTAASR